MYNIGEIVYGIVHGESILVKILTAANNDGDRRIYSARPATAHAIHRLKSLGCSVDLSFYEDELYGRAAA